HDRRAALTGRLWAVRSPRIPARLRGGRDSREREIDDVVDAERHAAGAGPLGMLIAQGRTRLAEAFLAGPGWPAVRPGSGPVDPGLPRAVPDLLPSALTQAGCRG